ncbi:hypothetical protein [Bacillus chungangensis]|uniref:Uncharacterized protein n=1 Tax=Bacillus chungangensis TaxID=587633 RepID=A0ABT9WUJ5_9BACI|nr:hypothetical protein [Bacillus chungangensis]MDQ0176978.1 hypothetical protein [Bacillus chungangensis]
MKKKQVRKPMVLASALILGMTAFAPLQTNAAEAVKKPTVEQQMEQQLKGEIIYHHDYEMLIKGEDGKPYRVGLYDFSEEQIAQMKLTEGAEIIVKGEVLENNEYFDSFEVYKKRLPEGVSEEDLAKIEVLFNESRELEKSLFTEVINNEETGEAAAKADQAKLDRHDEIWDEISDILDPYYPKEDPVEFDEYITSWTDLSMEELKEEISAEDLEKLQALYEEYLKLLEKDEEDLAWEKLDEFHDVLNPFFNHYEMESFEEFLALFEFEITDEDKGILEPLYEDAKAAQEAAETEEEWEAIWEKWDLAYEVLNPYFMEARVSGTFEEYMADFEYEISEEDLATLEPLYEEIKELTMNKDYDAADKKWEEFYEILEPYFEEYAIVPFRVYEVEINGKEYKAGAEEKVVEEKKEESKEANKEENKEDKTTEEKDASKDKSESTAKDA